MLKKQFLQKVLDAYVANATQVIEQISIREFLNGKLTLRNVTLKAETIQDLYGSYLPACAEVMSCHADELKLAVPWISLNSSPCDVEVGELSIQLRVRCSATSDRGDSPEEARFWKDQAERLASAVDAFNEHCQHGAQKPTLLSRVLGALGVAVRRIKLEIWRPGDRSPVVLGSVDGLRFQPTTQDWSDPKHINETRVDSPELYEARTFVLIEIKAVSLETPCGGAKAHLAPLVIKTVSKMPAKRPLMAPAPCTVHRTIDLGPLAISGSEDPLTILVGVLNDIYNSFGMQDNAGYMMQRYLPTMNEAAPTLARDRSELLKMRRKTAIAFENLVQDSRRASSALAGPEGAEALAQKLQEFAPAEQGEEDDDSNSSVGSECFMDALSESPDDEMDMVAMSTQRPPEERPTEAPTAAVIRKTVQLESVELRVTVAEGEIVLRLGQLDFLADGSRPLPAAVQKCCADLFEVPVGGQAPAAGTIIMELKLRGAEVLFNPRGQASGTAKRAVRFQKAQEGSSVVARLPEQDPPPVVLSKRGPGAPVPCGEVQAEPMQVLITSLMVQVGRGLDELRAWWGRLFAELPQLPAPPPPAMPSSCMNVRLLQTTVRQEPTDPGQVTTSGGWPLQVTLPLLEVKSTSTVAELPAAVGACLSASEEFEARNWWQPLFVAPTVNAAGSFFQDALNDRGSIEARLLASEQMVQWLERQNEELRAKASRGRGIRDAVQRWSVRRRERREERGTCCCAAPFAKLFSKPESH